MIDPADVNVTPSPVAVTLPTLIFPDVVVESATLRPIPPAVTVVASRFPPVALMVIAPSFVVAEVTAKPAAESLISIAPVPVTLAFVNVVIVVSKSIPDLEEADNEDAVTLFVAPFVSVIAPTAAAKVAEVAALTKPPRLIEPILSVSALPAVILTVLVSDFTTEVELRTTLSPAFKVTDPPVDSTVIPLLTVK